MSASPRVTAGPPSSYRAIENLIATYAELVDDGDFAGLGALLANATFTGGGAPVSGRYHDRFERRHGQWRFAERRVRVDLAGDVSRHLRHPK
jgi:hypothetical protein